MRISLSWLKDFIDLSDLTPEKIAESLTLAGLEVDAIEPIEPSFSGVVVGKVLSVAPHPNAERLQVAQVTDGKEVYQVVCGAPNCREGLVTAFAKIGASLSDEKGETYRIKKSKIRGVESTGMLCSEAELKKSAEHAGIIEFNGSLSVGAPYEDTRSDTIFTISLTPNLAHCMSVFGVARDLSGILGRPLNRISSTSVQEDGEEIAKKIDIAIEDTKACPRYAVRLVTGVKIGPSLPWIKERIESAGMRSVNNVVDITNYLLLEMGHPLHAFDYDQIAEKKIVVRRAKEAEKFTTLDGQEHLLQSRDLMICDGKRPVAIAGVMGGINSEVTEQTTNVLLEGAYFSPTVIGHTARRLGLLTESAARFEKGTDPLNPTIAIDKAAEMLRDLAGGTIATGIIDCKAEKFSDKKLLLRLSKTCALLGISLVQGEVQETIGRLDFRSEWQDDDHLTVWVPPYRHDITGEVDLIEEVARIYGYDNLPKKLGRYCSSDLPHSPIYLFEKEVRKRLIALGLQEMLTSDLISPSMLSAIPREVIAEEQIISVCNPVSIDQSILRPSLLPGLLDVIKHNMRHQQQEIAAFEMGCIYGVADGERAEQPMIGIVISGKKSPSYVDEKSSEWDFYDLKGIVEELLAGLGISSPTFSESTLSVLHPGRQASINIGGIQCGSIGEVHPSLVREIHLNQRILFATLNNNDLMNFIDSRQKMNPLAAYPSSERDWTLTVTELLPVGTILTAVQDEAPRILENIELLSIYSPASGGKNVTVRLRYRDNKKTLSQDFVDKQHAALCERVEKKIFC